MKILWVEDFSGLPSCKIIIEVFSSLIPKEIFDEEYDTSSPDTQTQLSNLFEKCTPHQIYLCASYSEWKRVYEQHGGQFDIALIDINLETYTTPADEIPEGIHNRGFDRKAGLYIYHQLIKHGFSDENMAFFTGEISTVDDYFQKCDEIFFERPKHVFEKNPAHFEMVRAWIKSKATEFQAKAKRIFISYSSKNTDIAERLYGDLQSNGVRCWFAPEDIKIGDKFRQRIDDAIHIHDKLLVILSAESVASNWVTSEVEAALEREDREKRLVLFPVKIDAAVEQSTTAWAALLRRTRHIGDFSQWKDHDSYRKAFERLLRDLKAETNVGGND
jgi:hypothetical protein